MSGNLNLTAKATGVLCLTLGAVVLTIAFESLFTNCIFKYIDKQYITLKYWSCTLLLVLLAGGGTLIAVGANEFTAST